MRLASLGLGCRSQPNMPVTCDTRDAPTLVRYAFAGDWDARELLNLRRQLIRDGHLTARTAVLLDLRMPDVSGQQVFEHWSTSAPRLSERVVFITGDIVSPDLHGFLESTGRPYLAKPFDFSQIMEVLPAERTH